ncbi:pyocin knob domain-containing protein [Acinetobacter sp. 102]|uniref:pyocin knob domain-containing protein n=1 Tax=Acinetobacter sp. 102 TaxID=3098766 RepID=UPI003009D7F9
MANINGSPLWSNIRVIEKNELAIGGIGGNMNEQAIALTNRTTYLNQNKASIEYVDSIVSAAADGTIPFKTEAELLASKHPQLKILAKAQDTRKEWFWNRTSPEGTTPISGIWSDSGLSDLDRAKNYTDSKINAFTSISTPADFNNYLEQEEIDFTNYTAIQNSQNIPIPYEGRLSIKKGLNSVYQRYHTRVGYAVREKIGATWYDWQIFTSQTYVDQKIDDKIKKTLQRKPDSVGVVDFNNFINDGITAFKSVTDLQNSQNVPVALEGDLIVTGSGNNITHIYVTRYGFLSRQKIGASWFPWLDLASKNYINSINLKKWMGYIPDAMNLFSYRTTGIWHQNQGVWAANGTNYPVPRAGKLEVFAAGVFTYQKYQVYDNGDEYHNAIYAPTSGTEQISGWRKVLYETDKAAIISTAVAQAKAYTDSVTANNAKDMKLNRLVEAFYRIIVGYGQSLSIGQNTTTKISETQDFSNVMFAGGVNSRSFESNFDSTIVPLIARDTFQTVNMFEPPILNCANALSLYTENRGYDANNFRYWPISGGRGGRSIEQLSKGSVAPENHFEILVNTLTAAKTAASAAGKTAAVYALSWVQGENNESPLNAVIHDTHTYAQYQTKLFDDLCDEIARIFGQIHKPHVYMYQTSTGRKYGTTIPKIAYAQWLLSRQHENFVMFAPCYMFELSSDLLHLTSEGSWLMGRYMARAIDKTEMGHEKWRPLEPISVDFQPTYIDVKFHVPVEPLQISTYLCPTIVNSGFDLWDGETDNVLNLITGVTVQSKDTVRLSISSAASANAVLSYGRSRVGISESGNRSRNRGNLHDCHGEYDKVILPITGTEFKMHNASVQFQFSRAKGFF